MAEESVEIGASFSCPTIPMPRRPTSAMRKASIAAAKQVQPAARKPTIKTSGESARSEGWALAYFSDTAVAMLEVTASPMEVPICEVRN